MTSLPLNFYTILMFIIALITMIVILPLRLLFALVPVKPIAQKLYYAHHQMIGLCFGACIAEIRASGNNPRQILNLMDGIVRKSKHRSTRQNRERTI